MFSRFLSGNSNKSTPSDGKDASSISPSLREFEREVNEGLERTLNQLESMPVHLLALVAFTLGGASSLGGAFLYVRYGRRIKNTDWITPDLFTRKRWIRGIVTVCVVSTHILYDHIVLTLLRLCYCIPKITSVGDADNFRLFHTPSLGGWRSPFKFRRIPTSNKGY
jgi:hypothetical protein